MGVIREFKCPSCYRTWRVRIGHGMMHGDINRVLKEFPADIQQKVRIDINGEQAPVFKFNYRAAACPVCQNIVAVPVIHVHRTNSTYSAGCPVCGGQAELLKEDSTAACPQCKNESLLIQDTGHWD